MTKKKQEFPYANAFVETWDNTITKPMQRVSSTYKNREVTMIHAIGILTSEIAMLTDEISMIRQILQQDRGL